MNKVQYNRLLNVARALRESPSPKRFDMGCYIHGGDEDEGVDNWCGSPACALGHYGARTDLQKIIRADYSDKNSPTLRFTAATGCREGDALDYDDSVILEHFGIDGDAAADMFSGYGCDGAQSTTKAAAYIEKYANWLWTRAEWAAAEPKRPSGLKPASIGDDY